MWLPKLHFHVARANNEPGFPTRQVVTRRQFFLSRVPDAENGLTYVESSRLRMDVQIVNASNVASDKP